MHDATGTDGGIITTRELTGLDRHVAPAGAADTALARLLDEFYRTAFHEDPIPATSLGIATGGRAAARGEIAEQPAWLHHVEEG